MALYVMTSPTAEASEASRPVRAQRGKACLQDLPIPADPC